MGSLVYFSSVSENTHRFVEKLELPAIRIPLRDRIQVDEPYVLVLRPTAADTPTGPTQTPGVTSPPSKSSPFSTTNTTGR